MRVLTVLGTRPEIIRLSLVIPKLDAACDHVLVHTGQNYAEGLSDVFFRELGVRAPDTHLGIRAATAGEQIGRILVEMDRVIRDVKPDALLVLGDTNSGLSAIVARRLGVPVYHMEAGNRCYDDRVPEEVNRRLIDHASNVLLPYTGRSAENLVREGIPRERILVIGNPIYEVLKHYEPQIAASDVLSRLSLAAGGFVLATMHRQENVDLPARLRQLVSGLSLVARKHGLPVVCSLHPRTRERLRHLEMGDAGVDVRFVDPLGFFDFVALERAAACIISDSGTVQEEACILRVPNVTIRDVTERPETLECGSNILSGADPDAVAGCVAVAMSQRPDWEVPPEYLDGGVSAKVVRILIGVPPGDPHAPQASRAVAS